MGTMKDYVNRYKAGKVAAKAAPPPAPSESASPTPSKPARNVAAADLVLAYKCKHVVGVRQITDQECPECRSRRRVRRKNAQEKKQKSQVPDDSGRLPDGTTINGSYDAARQMWNLQIVTPHGVFDGEDSSIHRLLMEVGRRGIEAARGR